MAEAVVDAFDPNTWNSASPMFSVDEDTLVIVSRMLVVLRDVNVIVVAPPALSRAEGQVTVEPSENVRVHPLIWSFVFGRSYSTTVSIVTADGNVSFTQDPALPPEDAHSLVESVG